MEISQTRGFFGLNQQLIETMETKEVVFASHWHV